MNKATFKAKVIFETERFNNPVSGKYPIITFNNIRKTIDNGKYEMEFIDFGLSNDCEPTIIIKDKTDLNNDRRKGTRTS